jgi:hypothetical protein
MSLSSLPLSSGWSARRQPCPENLYTDPVYSLHARLRLIPLIHKSMDDRFVHMRLQAPRFVTQQVVGRLSLSHHRSNEGRSGRGSLKSKVC